MAVRPTLRLGEPDLCTFCKEPVRLERCNTADGLVAHEECYLAKMCTGSPRKPVQSAGFHRIWSHPLKPTA